MKTYRPPRDLVASVEAVLRHPHSLHDKPHFGATFSPHALSYTTPLDRVVRALYEGRHYFWIGIYLVIGETAVRQAFCGPVPPCHSFALGKGNVGTAGQRGITKVVPDVNHDPTYSMCFRDTQSEIVVPIKIATRVLGVIDVESDQRNAFGPEERILLEEVAGLLARFLVADGKYILRQAGEKWRRESSTPKGGRRNRNSEARAAADSA